MRACMDADQVTRFARVDFRSDERVFGIKDEDRLLHVYVIGKTGTGKSTLLENMALQDLERGHGFALIDPHGDLVTRIAARVPTSRRENVIYLDATDPSQPYGYNPLRHVREDRIALAASGMMDVFRKMWPEAWGVRMEHILRNVLMALLEQPDATLHEVLRIFSDKEYRLRVGKSLRNETVRTFLLHEFDQFSFGYRADGTAPIQNKVGAFLADPLLNRILTAPEKDLRIRHIMDRGQVLLVNLAKGRIGDDSSSLLGGLRAAGEGIGPAVLGRRYAKLKEHTMRTSRRLARARAEAEIRREIAPSLAKSPSAATSFCAGRTRRPLAAADHGHARFVALDRAGIKAPPCPSERRGTEGRQTAHPLRYSAAQLFSL